MDYIDKPETNHRAIPKIGILLVNLGTPASPKTSDVRSYLKQFLSDPRVVEIPRLLWWFILNCIILIFRAKSSAKKYSKIWQTEGSPLRFHTAQQAKLVKLELEKRTNFPLVVTWAMRYGNPSIRNEIKLLRDQNCDRILIVPLYPQYAASTTASVFDDVALTYRKLRNIPEVRFIKHFHDHPSYIEATTAQIRSYWKHNGKPEKLVLSFHGVPKFTLLKGDPYHCECHKTARLIFEQLELASENKIITFQSRFGRAEWLTPYTLQKVISLAKANTKRLDVFCPGFVSDCLETLEEIDMENREAFLSNGGKEFHYIPCLNENKIWIKSLTDIVEENLVGWVPKNYDEKSTQKLASKREQLAKNLGAPS